MLHSIYIKAVIFKVSVNSTQKFEGSQVQLKYKSNIKKQIKNLPLNTLSDTEMPQIQNKNLNQTFYSQKALKITRKSFYTFSH